MITCITGKDLLLPQQQQILSFLSFLHPLYPGFQDWFAQKVMGSSDSLILLANKGERLVGVAIGRSGPDPKLRCVRVGADEQGTGLGLRLIDHSIEQLECERPHCTVAEEMIHVYSRPFVKRYGFQLSDVTKGEYRRGRLEYHWN